jgi:hypothetical protein
VLFGGTGTGFVVTDAKYSTMSFAAARTPLTTAATANPNRLDFENVKPGTWIAVKKYVAKTAMNVIRVLSRYPFMFVFMQQV